MCVKVQDSVAPWMAAGRPKAVLEDGRAAGACRAAVSVCSARTLACETAARERDCAASEISIAPSVSLQLPCRLWLPSVPPSSRVLYLTLSRLTRLSAAADRSNVLLPTFTARLPCYAFCSPQPSALLQASFPPAPAYLPSLRPWRLLRAPRFWLHSGRRTRAIGRASVSVRAGPSAL